MGDGVSVSLPGLSWFDEPIKSSINSVFGGINTKIESVDLFRKYRTAHFSYLRELVGKVKVLGMANALPLAEIYYPTCVSGGIRRRLYTSEWHSIQAGDHPAKLTSGKSKTLDGAEQLEKSSRLVVLGGPGAGKTTFLKFIALAYLDKAVFQSTKLKGSRLPFFVALLAFHR